MQLDHSVAQIFHYTMTDTLEMLAFCNEEEENKTQSLCSSPDISISSLYNHTSYF